MDFGDFTQSVGIHHFRVDIPASPKDPITIYEDYGFDLTHGKREMIECRAILSRSIWMKLRDTLRRNFNERLKEREQPTGSWTKGSIKVDRFLGRELCVLAWAAELASLEECPGLCLKWSVLRPEERWWLYAKTVAEAGLASQANKGWRQALYWILQDDQLPKPDAPRTPKPSNSSSFLNQESLLFDLFPTD